ncbi:MAG TPA: ParB/RepB/Spo0J family partition protein [Armatimonadota bacterium]|jgi:hypothetical protein
MAQRLRTASVPRATVRAHPRNPRPVNDERVEAMAASYESDPSILERHPILVYMSDGQLTVISGHHRLMMANRLNLPDVWVDEWQMTDDEAYFELVRANEQEPLDLLSYGKHFAHMPQRMLPGQYAKAIGRSATFVAAARRAADVYDALPKQMRDRVGTEFGGWYLAHIGRADPGVWLEIAEQVFGSRLTVTQTELLVNEYLGKAKRPNAPAPSGGHTDGNPFLEDANAVQPATEEEREAFMKEAAEAGRQRRKAEDEPMFRSGGGAGEGRRVKAMKIPDGADPREVFGMVLHLFRQAQEFVFAINPGDLDGEQKDMARQLLKDLLDSLDR